jgi:hypothetical protein
MKYFLTPLSILIQISIHGFLLLLKLIADFFFVQLIVQTTLCLNIILQQVQISTLRVISWPDHEIERTLDYL